MRRRRRTSQYGHPADGWPNRSSLGLGSRLGLPRGEMQLSRGPIDLSHRKAGRGRLRIYHRGSGTRRAGRFGQCRQ